MKKYVLFGIIAFLAGLIIMGRGDKKASASSASQGKTNPLFSLNQQASPTLIPTDATASVGEPTHGSRTLPAVGTNAGLVIGAMLLVLIIIGGVLSSRLRAKH